MPCHFYLFIFYLLFFPRLISAVGDWMSTILPRMSEMCCTWLAENTGRKKSPFRHHRTTLSGYILAAKACIGNRKTDTSSTYPHDMVNFGLLTAEICWQVWGIPANFNGFRVLASSLHGTLVLDCSQTLPRSTEDATYIRRAAITLGIGPHF